MQRPYLTGPNPALDMNRRFSMQVIRIWVEASLAQLLVQAHSHLIQALLKSYVNQASGVAGQLDGLLVENRHTVSPQSSENHAEFQHHVLACSISLPLGFSNLVPLIVGAEQHTSKSNIAVLSQIPLQFLNDGIPRQRAGVRELLG